MGWLDDVIEEPIPPKTLSEEQRIDQEIYELLGWVEKFNLLSLKPIQADNCSANKKSLDPLAALQQAESEKAREDFQFQSLVRDTTNPPKITDLGELRKIAKSILCKELKSSTLDEYQKATKTLDGQHWLIYSTQHCVSKKRAGVLRAAWIRYQAEKIIIILKKINATPDKEEVKRLRGQASHIAGDLLAKRAAYQPPEHYEKKKVRGTRSSLKGLKPSWREDTIYCANKRDQLAIAIMRLTGARPGEMCKLFTLERDEKEPNHVRIVIQGEKVSDLTGAGQPWRELTVDISVSPISAIIINNALGDSTSLTSRVESTEDAFSKRVAAACLRAGHTSVSAKSFRHAIASDMKLARGSDAFLSIALGHVSESSRQLYGHYVYAGKGKCPILNAVAARTLNKPSENNFEPPSSQARAAIRSGTLRIDEASGEMMDPNIPGR